MKTTLVWIGAAIALYIAIHQFIFNMSLGGQ